MSLIFVSLLSTLFIVVLFPSIKEPYLVTVPSRKEPCLVSPRLRPLPNGPGRVGVDTGL